MCFVSYVVVSVGRDFKLNLKKGAQIKFGEKFRSAAINHSFFSGEGLLSLHKSAGASAKGIILPTEFFLELLLPWRERLETKV